MPSESGAPEKTVRLKALRAAEQWPERRLRTLMAEAIRGHFKNGRPLEDVLSFVEKPNPLALTKRVRKTIKREAKRDRSEEIRLAVAAVDVILTYGPPEDAARPKLIEPALPEPSAAATL